MKKALSTLGLAAGLALGGLGLSATPLNPAPPKAEAAGFVSCYWSMHGDWMCYRYGCTIWERVAYGCYNGWVKVNRPHYT